MDGKKLTRSATDRMLCGVCGGIAKYLNIDTTVIRLIWAILSIGSIGAGVVLYFIAAIIMPMEE